VTGLHPHESPKVMTVPLMILAFLSVFGGFLNVPSLFGGDSKFGTFLQSDVSSVTGEEISHTTEIGLIVFSTLLIGLIIVFAYRIFVRNGQVPKGDSETMSFTGRLITNKFYLDELYILAFEKPFRLLSDFLFKHIETKVLNPAVEGIGAATLRLGGLVRKIQRGNISFYFFAMIAGILLFIIFILTI
jgi:NADH-quinone oxidoreductase subunit L